MLFSYCIYLSSYGMKGFSSTISEISTLYAFTKNGIKYSFYEIIGLDF